MGRPGRPLKAESEIMAFLEDGIASFRSLERYAERRWVETGAQLDRWAMQEAGEMAARWRDIRSACFRQGLLFEGDREEDE